MSLLSAIKRLFGFSKPKIKSGDRMLTCLDCRSQFVFDAGEQIFFKSKGFTDPKRCPHCRKKVKTHIRKKRRGNRKPERNFSRRDSLIDGDSPYQDER